MLIASPVAKPLFTSAAGPVKAYMLQFYSAVLTHHHPQHHHRHHHYHHHHNSLGSMVCEKGTKNFGTGVDIGHLKYPASLSMSARLSDIFKYMMIYALSTIYQCFLNTSSRICWIEMSWSEVWHLRISSDIVTPQLWSMTSLMFADFTTTKTTADY